MSTYGNIFHLTLDEMLNKTGKMNVVPELEHCVLGHLVVRHWFTELVNLGEQKLPDLGYSLDIKPLVSKGISAIYYTFMELAIQ